MICTGIFRETPVQQHERLANHNPYLKGIETMTTPHSIAEFTVPEVSPANNRLGTVSYASRYPDYTHIPAIIMKGRFRHRLQIRCQSDARLHCADGQAAGTGRTGVTAVAASGVQAVRA